MSRKDSKQHGGTVTDVQHHGRVAYFRDATITAKGHKTVHMTYNGMWLLR